jgi:hypothetical protein
MTSTAKQKGNSYEREIAKFLSDLYGESFIRAPGSGAYVGGKNAQRRQFLHEGQVRSFKGDIVPGQSFPRLNAECKSYKDFPFHQLFTGEVGILDKWIEQCMAVADRDDFNILFMKFNRKGKYVAFENKPRDHLKLSTLKLNTETNSLNHTETNSIFNLKNFITYDSKKYGSWTFMDHETFFTFNAEQFKGLTGPLADD